MSAMTNPLTLRRKNIKGMDSAESAVKEKRMEDQDRGWEINESN